MVEAMVIVIGILGLSVYHKYLQPLPILCIELTLSLNSYYFTHYVIFDEALSVIFSHIIFLFLMYPYLF